MVRQGASSVLRRAVVSGAAGFIGSRLVNLLAGQGVHVVALTRDPSKGKLVSVETGIEWRQVDFRLSRDIGPVCQGATTVFHLAGYAHAEDANDDAASALHGVITVEGTRALINEAVRAGVQHFVFVSSAKVMGEASDYCLNERAPISPATAYSRAKYEAEKIVLGSGAAHGMHVTVLRLPLVYGPGNKGNLRRMIEAIDCGRFPSLPETNNKRSLVHVDDVVQALGLAVANPKASGEVYFVTDGHIYSTFQICRLIRSALGRAEPKWSVPIRILRAVTMVGDAIGMARGRPIFINSLALNKLIHSAWYSSEKIERELGFKPTYTLQTALPQIIKAYRREK